MECGKPDGQNYENEGNEQNVKHKSKKFRSKGSFALKNKSSLKIFCEGHRPFKLIQEIKERQEVASDELKKF